MQEQLNIHMLGRFEIFLGEQEILAANARNSKLVQLLEYMICRRGTLVSQKELVETVLHSEVENPAVVLKNLVYRLRKLFGAFTDVSVIGSTRSGYGFLPKLDCRVDLEDFLALEREAFDTKRSPKQQLKTCMQALDLYVGPLLPKASAELWVMKRSTTAQTLYERYLTGAYEICGQLEQSERLLPYLAHACEMLPYQESVQYMYIQTLYSLRKTTEALRQYEGFATLLYDDLCVAPSAKLQDLYKEVLSILQPTAAYSAAEVRTTYREGDDRNGAFYCPPEVFARLFQYAVRQTERTNQTIMLMLCTLTEQDGRQPSGGLRLREIAQNLNEAIAGCCRAGDAYTRNSPSQFTLLLSGTSDENWSLVAERLRREFYSHRGMRSVRLLCDCISAVDYEHLQGEKGEE